MFKVCVSLAVAGALWSFGGLAANAAPPVAAPVEAYGRLPAISNVTLSPSGDRLAFVADDGAGRKLFVRTVAGQPLAVTPLGDKKLRDVYWGGERFVVFTVSETRKLMVELPPMELMAGFVLDLETRTTTRAFRGAKSWDVIFDQYGTAEINGRWYAYFSTFEQTRLDGGDIRFKDYNADLFRVDLETGAGSLVNRGDEATSDWVLRGDEVAARMAYVPKTGAWRATAGETGRVLVEGVEPLAEVGLIGLGRSSDSVLLGQWDEQGRATAVEIALADGARRDALPAGTDMLAPIYDRTSRLLIGYTLSGDERRTIFFDPSRQAMIDKIGRAFAGKRPWVVSTSASQDRVVVYTDGGDDSGSYWLVDLKALKADPLGEEYPKITPSRVGLSRRFGYKASDGLAIDGILTLPPGREAKALPVVVMPHGGPEGRSGLGFDWQAQAYAARGYAVFQPNFRGSSGYGKAFRDAGFGEWGRKMQTDITDGLAALAAQGVVDPKRACIVGSSYGGYAALAGVTVQTGFYRCAVSVAGISDLNEMISQETSDAGGPGAGVRYWRAFLGSDKPGGAATLAIFSPARQAARADAPILLIHGEDDTVVPIDQSRRMERALRLAGKPVEFLMLDGEDHWLSRETSRIAMLKASVDFVVKHNPPD